MVIFCVGVDVGAHHTRGKRVQITSRMSFTAEEYEMLKCMGKAIIIHCRSSYV
jgi:hypothetical protein